MMVPGHPIRPKARRIEQNPARSAETMIKLMEIGQPFADPQQMMMMGEQDILDMKELFTRVDENMKIKDVDRLFKPNPMIPPPMGPEVVGDEAMAAGMQAGNFVPPGAM